MRIKIKKNEIWRIEDDMPDTLIGILTDEANDNDEKIIQAASEVLPAVERFIESVNSGNYKPRSVVRELEILINKYE